MSESLLIKGPSIPLIPNLACAVGLNEAIVLQQIHYWTMYNREKKQTFADGQYWVYNSYSKWREQFPWLSERTIQRLFSSLEKRNLIISSTHNKLKIDRTKWYRVNYEEVERIVSLRQSGTVDNANLTKPLLKKTYPKEYKIHYREEKEEVQFELPEPTFLQDVATTNSKKRSDIFNSVTEKFGYERASYMLSVVDWYIDKAYPYYVGTKHPEESKAKRMVFAEKLLLCSDATVQDDQVIADAMHRVLQEYDNCDPTIYYITTPKILGYWLLKDDEVSYDFLNGTEYAPADNIY